MKTKLIDDEKILVSIEENDLINGNVNIPDDITFIGNGAFSNNTKLTSMNIPHSSKSIGFGAFFRCINLIRVTIPNGVKSIGFSAFYDCTNLSSIVIPDSVTSIGENAFYNCTSLTSITIPDSVTSIKDSTFCNCTNLKSITISGTIDSIESNAFQECNNIAVIIINTDNKARYTAIKDKLPEQLKPLVIDFTIYTQAKQHRQNILARMYGIYHPLNALPMTNQFNNFAKELFAYDSDISLESMHSMNKILENEVLPLTENELTQYKEKLDKISALFYLKNYNKTIKEDKRIPADFFSFGSRPKQKGNQDIQDTYHLVERIIDCLTNDSPLKITKDEEILLAKKPKLLSLIPKTIQEQWKKDGLSSDSFNVPLNLKR